jgi:RNA polymerase sigma-70 factor (ECF subfamily)
MDSSEQHDQFVERFIRCQARIYAFVVTLLPNRADADEVFQQTSLIATGPRCQPACYD